MTDYLTTKEIAEILKVHPKTVSHWIRKGRLPAIRPGTRNYRVAKVDFEAFIEQRRTNKSA